MENDTLSSKEKAKIPGKEDKKFLIPDNSKDILEEILHTYKTFELTETVKAIKQIINKFSFKGITFKKIPLKKLTDEEKKEAEKIFNEFKEKSSIKNTGFFDKMLNVISEFNDNKNPYPYLDFIDSEEFMNYSETDDDRETKLWKVIAFSKVYELSKNKIIIEKIETYNKWLKSNILLFNELPEELSKYKFVYYLEAIDKLINVYNFIFDKKIKPKLCFYTMKLIVFELTLTKKLDKFDILDFFEMYNKSIRNKYNGFMSTYYYYSKNNKNLSLKEVNLKFAEEFKYQYLQKIILTRKLI